MSVNTNGADDSPSIALAPFVFGTTSPWFHERGKPSYRFREGGMGNVGEWLSPWPHA